MQIEKITNQNQIARHKLAEKINELVDAVNKLDVLLDLTNIAIQAIKNEDPKNRMIGCTTFDKVEGKMNLEIDPYAEQRKWIGCLVEYGNADDGFKYGILTNIEPIYSAYPFEIDNGRNATADCWLPSKTIFYKGGDND